MKKCISIMLIVAIAVFPVLLANATNEVNCLSALQKMIPCQTYLVYGAPIPSPICCQGVKDLAEIANTSKTQRQSLCQCLKSVAQNFPINEEKSRALPNLCHVNLNIAITPNIDCTKYIHILPSFFL